MITIIVATKNSAHYLSDALRTLAAHRARMPIVEVLFIDGGSTDDTLDLIAAFGDGQVLPQRTSGLYAALNEGVEHARGSHVLFLHSDDMIGAWPTHPLALHRESVHVGSVDFVRADGVTLFTRRPGRFPRSALPQYPFLLHPNAIYPVWALRRFPYDEARWGPHADRYQIAAMAQLVNFEPLPAFVYQFRIHPTSATSRVLRSGVREPLVYWFWRFWVFLAWEDRKMNRLGRRLIGRGSFSSNN